MHHYWWRYRLTNALHYLKAKRNVKCQIAELNAYLNLLEYKLAFYQKAKALGPVEAVNLPQIPETT